MPFLTSGNHRTYVARGLHNLGFHACVSTIGSFDGVHLGHQAVIEQLKSCSARLGLPNTVIIFEPQPAEFLSGCPFPRLMRLNDKLRLFAQFGVDQLLCLRFDEDMATYDPTEFVEYVLFDQIGIRCLVVGDDFRFGKDRQGGFELLKALGTKRTIEVLSTDSFCLDGERVSSTGIRLALEKGEITKANKFLGRPYRIRGRVIHGEKKARKLGYPTANLNLGSRLLALSGVYTVHVSGVEATTLKGIAYFGYAPALDGKKYRAEAHIFNFNGTLYGKRLEVELINKLRDDETFDNIKALEKQMKQDICLAKAQFGLK